MLLCGRATRVITQNKNTFIHQPDDGEEQKEEEGRGGGGEKEHHQIISEIEKHFKKKIHFIKTSPLLRILSNP